MNSFLKAFVDSLVNARVEFPPSPLAEAREGRWLHLVGQHGVTRLPLGGDAPMPAREIDARVARRARFAARSDPKGSNPAF